MDKKRAFSTSIEIYTHLRKLLAAVGVPKSHIRVNSHLRDDLKLNYQGKQEWIRAVEDYFDIEIDQQDRVRIFRVSHMVDVIVEVVPPGRQP